MKIRETTKNDIEQIRRIYSDAWIAEKNGPIKEEDVNHFIESIEKTIKGVPESADRDYHYFVSESEDGNVSGVIGFRKPDNKLLSFTITNNPVELYSLFVANKQKGAGSALVQRMEEFTKDNGYTEIVVFSANRWKDSWIFYDKIGFTRCGTMRDTSGEISQIWRKGL